MISELQEARIVSRGGPKNARDRLLAAIPLHERRMELAGISTAVLEGGYGPPIVLLHGPGEFAAVWMRVIPSLVATHHVVVPDLPGHGESGAGEAPIDVARITQWLSDLIQGTCASPPVVVGHCLGGAIALRFAIQNPDRLRGLVLVDSYGLAPFRPTAKFAFALIRFMMRPNARTQERVFRGCFADYDGLRSEVGAPWDALAEYALDRAVTPQNRTVMRNLMPKLAMPAIPHADLARISVPTTLLWGRHDLQVRLRIAETASARYGWPLHVIENARDDPAFEEPDAFLRALR
ncbi:MAG: alpha/beta fold hydrolase, partial [Gemmatimonadaceae bacterium]